MITTVLLDFDGTLADTRAAISETLQTTLRQLSLPLADEDRLRHAIGLPLEETFRHAAGIADPALLRKCAEIYRSRFNEIGRARIALYPGVANTLEVLKRKGILLAIASSRGRQSLEFLIKKLGIGVFFSVIGAGEDAARPKPAPDLAQFILAKTGTARENALMVGDTMFDIQMGRFCGIKTCGAAYGNHSVNSLREAGADCIIENFASLADVVFPSA